MGQRIERTTCADGSIAMRVEDSRSVLHVACGIKDCDWSETHDLDYGISLDALMDHLCTDLGHDQTPPVLLAVDL